MTGIGGLLQSLPAEQRLAMAYAPARCRASLLGLLALDRRLASIVRSSREPMLAQLRLAWWREQLSQDPAQWPEGEPLLAALRDWRGDRGTLAGLTAGWEAMTGAAPLPVTSFESLAEARAGAFAALAGPHYHAAALRMARNWALADIAARLSHPQEREAAMSAGTRPGLAARELAARSAPAGPVARSCRAQDRRGRVGYDPHTGTVHGGGKDWIVRTIAA